MNKRKNAIAIGIVFIIFGAMISCGCVEKEINENEYQLIDTVNLPENKITKIDKNYSLLFSVASINFGGLHAQGDTITVHRNEFFIGQDKITQGESVEIGNLRIATEGIFEKQLITDYGEFSARYVRIAVYERK